jgi:hypothetical protein
MRRESLLQCTRTYGSTGFLLNGAGLESVEDQDPRAPIQLSPHEQSNLPGTGTINRNWSYMRIAVEVLVATLFVAASAVKATAQSNTCHAADGGSANVIRAVNALMKPELESLRTRFGVPFASASQIALITDPRICARAGQALDSLASAWAPSQPQPPENSNPLYVVQLGSYFAVVDHSGPSLEHYHLIFYFSPLWKFLTMATF